MEEWWKNGIWDGKRSGSKGSMMVKGWKNGIWEGKRKRKGDGGW